MDEDAEDLARALLTKVGMIMEDASPIALLVADDIKNVSNAINRLEVILSKATRLLAAARTAIE